MAGPAAAVVSRGTGWKDALGHLQGGCRALIFFVIAANIREGAASYTASAAEPLTFGVEAALNGYWRG
ncbi:hypothetical protein H112_02525 [Trichophyton rubrum D6]|uniref:Uncharacterized protein n=2 Tax=Trichophyton TaxID=5550 RepID=A0A022W8T0_TRIRU|nr:hypothetical protein H100_02526 [Trichophyton rubrum MR850]EZF44110.1 hypothetical protein H102_02520 [Trichophyton rubrum CBS 100081]EZF54757.1 hypothetical protein H103_02533 [Trichophyton rubrum CBS 288.86]EZF65375.1 hypothetical protein H104_02511 [Trichophyton rubrum CBS 289.86]EZF76052.1 hypothetical protein H105_02538 [Trichophyton soudanense CBS 452.61]EZF86669.1 hypothetical protein H110_02530 [Trichophyton rubrum MR1448]EZF97461.1 hypothetical protein H113_02539 [Trichophyton rub